MGSGAPSRGAAGSHQCLARRITDTGLGPQIAHIRLVRFGAGIPGFSAVNSATELDCVCEQLAAIYINAGGQSDPHASTPAAHQAIVLNLTTFTHLEALL